MIRENDNRRTNNEFFVDMKSNFQACGKCLLLLQIIEDGDCHTERPQQSRNSHPGIWPPPSDFITAVIHFVSIV